MLDKIYKILESEGSSNKISKIYEIGMIITIIISLLPLAFKEISLPLVIIDRVTVIIFIIDYLLRWITADKKYHKGWKSFVKYPFTPMAIIDLISILPSLILLNPGFKVMRTARLLRILRTAKVFKVFKAFRYSVYLQRFINVFREQKGSLLIVCLFAVGYILISSLVIFNVEPDTFDSFFDAVYWATVSLTTVGYGDIYPVTTPGRIVTMVSSVMGIAIVALPAGIITAGYVEEIKKDKEK